MHLGMSYNDTRKLPIIYRRWFIERLKTHFEKRNDMYNGNKPSDNASENTSKLNKYQEMLAKKFTQ